MLMRFVALFLLAATASAADLSAQLTWSQQVDISVPVSGVVEAIHVQPGQRVARGTPLLRLNQTVFKANLMEARADLDRLNQESVDARRELERANELYARTVSSTTELDAARLRHASTQARLAMAEARLEKARRHLDESEPRAPYDALVLDRFAEPGMTVAAQCQPATLLQLARADELLARASVSPEQLAQLRLEDPAQVVLTGDAIPARIIALRSRADGRYQVDVALTRADGLLPGMAASIRLP